MSRFWIAVIVAIAAAATAVAAQSVPAEEARERNLRGYIDLLRGDARAQKVAVITEMMQLTDDEAAAFWPVYREYEVELRRLNDERLAAIETYGRTFASLTPAIADELALQGLDLEARRTALKQRYYAKLKSALPPITAVRVLQVENQIELVIDLQVAALLPFTPAAAARMQP